MAHVELSLSGAFVPQARTPSEAEFVTSVERWSMAVAAADEPCLVIDIDGLIIAVSPSCSELLGLGKPVEALGRPVTSLNLLDFTANAGRLEEPEADNIPPMLALRSERLARGLIRVLPRTGETPLTLDAISTPLMAGDRIGGALTFLSPVRY
ncbi:hypothetical protein [Actinoplanes couchii]|uniref:PAS domain-containing protein n=1 Tax=Actinoplanes couchii TaxID=403638 RepID=A0ABQ3XJ82_9ACTN|nr:hypothetical protein [Actinoplanes couchii]MDR6324444.1 PAS domain-containing protein [Actinoplanes couchii]GID58555.1 hypothetical protein Aco03nite_069590 [Actinoplanes couchii]